MVRKQFTFYRSYLDSALKLKRSADREKFLMAIIEYALDGNEPANLSEICDVAFSMAKPVLDSSRKKAESASKGGSVSCKQTQAKVSNGKQEEANRKLEIGLEKEIELDIDLELLQQNRSKLLEKLWQEYPAHRRGSLQNLTDTAAMLSLGNDDVVKATENLATWKNSRDWSKDDGQYVPGLTRYLTSGMWADKPKKTELPKGASGELGEAELEAIRRVLAEPIDDQEGGG